MPPTISRFQNEPVRKRRVHAKSRKGCGNCKLRRIKCDETRPHCKKCLSYSVSCSYDKTASLDLNTTGAFCVDLGPSHAKPLDGPEETETDLVLHKPPVSANQGILNMLNSALEAQGISDWHGFKCKPYTDEDLQTFQRFQQRTVYTIGPKAGQPLFRKHLGPMAFTYPFLMRTLLSLTLTHDAHLTPTLSTPQTTTSLHHRHAGTLLFNAVLSRPIDPLSRDALWATATLIGANIFASIDTTPPAQSWPLKPPDPSDLNWLKLSNGKKAIWKIAQPMRPESIFRSAAGEHVYNGPLVWLKDQGTYLASLPESAKRLLGIDERSTAYNNPYHLPALIVCRLRGIKPSHENLMRYLHFVAYMSPAFQALLERKERRALLVLGWWLRLVRGSELWWLARRAEVEGDAVRVFLEREGGVWGRLLGWVDGGCGDGGEEGGGDVLGWGEGGGGDGGDCYWVEE